MKAGHDLHQARIAAKVFHADLDVVDHQPSEPAHDGNDPGVRLGIANDDERAWNHPAQIVDLTTHATPEIILVLDLPGLGNRVERVHEWKRCARGGVE